MATIKSDWLGITRSTTSTMTETTTGEALKSFSGVYNRAVTTPELSNNDLVFDSKYVIFSFPLSRPWGELSWYLDSRISIVIQGRNCNNEDVVKTICNLKETGNSLICEWSKYFGIIRIAVAASLLREFNYITYVGAVMTRKDNTSATGCIYKIGSKSSLLGKEISLNENFASMLCAGVSGSVNGIYDSNNNPITHSISYISVLKGADENPQSSRKYISNGIAFSPAGSDGGCYFYSVKGINKNRTNHKNSRYYFNAAFFQYDSLKIGGEYVYPSKVWIDNNEQSNVSTRQSIVDIVGTAEYNPEVKMLYGGYYYQLSDTYKSTYSSLLYYTNFGQFSNETEFFTYFGFSGERYRTKFLEYENYNSLKLYSQYVSGTLTVKYAADSPFEQNSTGISITNTDEQVTFEIVDNNLSKTNSEYISNLFSVSVTLKNRFTGEDEANYIIKIPLYDENLYYIFGDMLQIETSAIAADKLKNFNSTLSDQKEIVLYSDMTLPDQTFKDTKILDISTENLINTVKTWRILNSETPITNPEKPERTGDDLEGSYFSYYFPHIEFGNIDITNDIKFYNDLEYYSILKCKPFLKQTASAAATNYVSDLKIQDGKLFYKLKDQGLGDYNDNFSINQFINYGIDGRHPIGLSSFDTNKRLGIYVPKTITNGAITEWELKYTKQTEANEDSTATLKLFYTNTLHSFEIPNFDLSKVGAGGLPLRLRYYDNELNYTIFEVNIGTAVVVAGTRPLGLRKQGVIVNPLLPNEQLPNGTAERINLKANITTETTETEPEVETVKASGNIVEMIVCNDNGTILEDKDGNDIKCTIEYRGTQKEEEGDQKKTFYEGGFYFDGINLQTLKNTTIENTQTIATILQALESQKLLIKSGSKDYKIYQAAVTPDKNVTGSDSISITMNETIPDNAIIHTLLYTTRKTGVVGQFDVTKGAVTKNGNTFTIPYSYIYDCYAFTNDSSDDGGWVTVVAYVIAAFNSLT